MDWSSKVAVRDEHGIGVRHELDNLSKAVLNLQRQFPGDTEVFGLGGDLNAWVHALASVEFRMACLLSELEMAPGDAGRYETEYFANKIKSGEWE